jgi:RNA polymerase sigma factor (sigma-70 family)
MSDAPFPVTHRSAVLRARSTDAGERRAAFEALVRSYWKPVYKYLRLRWRLDVEDAEDTTQGFFARSFDKGDFARWEPARGRFRTFLRACLDAYAANARRDARRLKRGGGVQIVPLEFATAEGELREHPIAAEGADPDALFQAEWVRSLFTQAVEALQAHCAAADKSIQFELFEKYDLGTAESPQRLTYADLAAQTGLPVTQVTNHLAAARREFRRLVLELLRDVCTTEEEFRAEARAVLGVDPP